MSFVIRGSGEAQPGKRPKVDEFLNSLKNDTKQSEWGLLADPDAQFNPPHATSTLRQLQREDVLRSEKIINIEVGSMLAGYEDPIKLLMPPIMQAAAVVHIKRKYVVGGIASRVPERAPAPVSMVQEDVRTVKLQRYGGDVDFNLNACLQPDAFKREMDMKIKAQHGALSNELNKLGYQMLMDQGTSIVDAMARSMGAGSKYETALLRDQYVTQVFGALSKFSYPIQNLLAIAKRCTAYDISRSVKSVMILPHGVPEMMQYTKAENMRYEINGIRGPQGKPVTLEVSGGYQVPGTTASVFVHVPPALHTNGAAAPIADDNSLERIVNIRVAYNGKKLENAGITIKNLFSRTREDFSDVAAAATSNDRKACFASTAALGKIFEFDDNAAHQAVAAINSNTKHVLVVTYKMRMQSALIGIFGEETGNLLMQYPRSTVSSDASTESGRLQLRVYMNAILKRPENVLVMNNVAFNGFDGKPVVSTFATIDAAQTAYKEKIYNGQIRSGSTVVTANNGHFGPLDDVENCGPLSGMQIFNPNTLGGPYPQLGAAKP